MPGKFMLKLVLMWTLCLLLFPLLVLQGIWVRRTTVSLPEAAHPNHGTYDGKEPPIHILGLGDSVIAGVGVNDLEESVTAQIARSTSRKVDRRVNWRADGCNGDKARDLLARYQAVDNNDPNHLRFSETGELLEPAVPFAVDRAWQEDNGTTLPDYVVVSIGVNDVSGLTSLTRWNFEITQVIASLREHFGVPILFLGIPPMARFPALIHPLKFALGVRAAMLDKTIQRAAELLPDVHWIDSLNLFQLGHMAADGYHPSTIGCEVLGEVIAEVVVKLEKTSAERTGFVQITDGKDQQ